MHNVVSNENSKINIPPGLQAFITDTNRANRDRDNNHYSLKQLIENNSYYGSNGSNDCTREYEPVEYEPVEYYSSLNEYKYNNEIEQLLTMHLELLTKQKQELQALVVQEHEKQPNDFIIQLKKICKDMKLNNTNKHEIISFMITNNVTWNYFDTKSPKKIFVNPLRKYCQNIKYGTACKIWQKMSAIYNFKQNNTQSKRIMSEVAVTIPSRDRSLIFISEQCTQKAIDNKLISENFQTSKQLFHFLRWTIKMQQIDWFYKIFSSNENRIGELVIFNTELHENKTGAVLYIIGIDNDKMTVKSPRWKMKQFMTAAQILEMYAIKTCSLPLGSRTNGEAFKPSSIQKETRFIILYGFIRRYVGENIHIIVCKCYGYYSPQNNYYRKYKYSSINNIAPEIYSKLPQIKTQQKREKHKTEPNELLVTNITFYKYINLAINYANNNGENEFISIVSFDKHKTQYFIDWLLPVQLTNNNWIGIIFRNNNPISICIDCHDIKTKAKLFDANIDINQYKWLRNDITRLTIITLPSSSNSKYNNSNSNLNLNKNHANLRAYGLNKHVHRKYIPQQKHKLVLKEVMYK